MAVRHPLAAIALAALSLSATAEDYLGVLRPARAGLAPPSGVFALGAEAITNGLSPFKDVDQGFRLKLGYRYSRYFSVEGNFLDLPRAPADIFSNPTNFSSSFRSSAASIDTIATLPVWRSFSFYGRLGAIRGDAPRSPFATYSTSLLNESARSRWRYGLGMRYDFTRSFGVRAELERYAPLGSPLAGEGPDADQVSVGFAWRF